MLEEKCRAAIERYSMLSPGDRVVVGLSGGADSCALLHFLCGLRDEFGLTVAAVHVNHMIRGAEAERDASFAGNFCEKLGVAFYLYERDVPSIAAEKGLGLEACGREIRYGILESEADALGAKIATAHTLSDSVETVLFHIIRGCSLTGLKGIPPVRGRIIRPLIECERSDVEEYCSRMGIEYVTDSTNFSDGYARNKIRLKILPLMREINPSALNAIGRLAGLAREDDDYLNAAADSVVENYLESGRADALFGADPPILGRALMAICWKKLNIVPERRHIVSMVECMGRGNGAVNLPGGHLFRVKGQTIVMEPYSLRASDAGDFSDWRADLALGVIMTPVGQKIVCRLMNKNSMIHDDKNEENVFKNCLDYDKIKKAVFRFRREGDSFLRAGRKGTKSLKKLLNEEKIPAEIRGVLPMLEIEDRIAWICGIGAAEPFKVTGATEKVLYINADLRDIIYQGGHFQ
jgi:tRNA(Ile)-lysidine synthetase, N-terminal domain/tRNA(Ile)-lysidine synthetase, C-terminal domain